MELAIKLIDRIAWVLQQGWTQSAYARNRWSEKVEPTEPSAVRWCVIGAKRLAVHQLKVEAPVDEAEIYNASTQVADAFNWVARKVYDADNEVSVNDQHDQTQDGMLGFVAAVKARLLSIES